jgi:hypothetical protein
MRMIFWLDIKHSNNLLRSLKILHRHRNVDFSSQFVLEEDTSRPQFLAAAAALPQRKGKLLRFFESLRQRFYVRLSFKDREVQAIRRQNWMKLQDAISPVER